MGIEKYLDILDLPHHVSATRPHRSMVERGAQFSPFAALTGYDAAIEETGRLTDKRIVLDEDAEALMNEQLQLAAECIRERPCVDMTYFKPDERKEGGRYVRINGRLKKMDPVARTLTTVQGLTVPVDALVSFSVLQEPSENS